MEEKETRWIDRQIAYTRALSGIKLTENEKQLAEEYHNMVSKPMEPSNLYMDEPCTIELSYLELRHIILSLYFTERDGHIKNINEVEKHHELRKKLAAIAQQIIREHQV